MQRHADAMEEARLQSEGTIENLRKKLNTLQEVFCLFVCLCWGLTSQSTIFQSYRDGAIASWVINQYFRGVKSLAQGHNTAAVGLEPRTSRSGVRHSTTEPPRSPLQEVIHSSTPASFTKNLNIFILWTVYIGHLNGFTKIKKGPETSLYNKSQFGIILLYSAAPIITVNYVLH